MKDINITEERAKKYNLPGKAVGKWRVVGENETDVKLHRLKADGELGSDRRNNLYSLERRVASILMPKPAKAKAENEIGTRKAKWIDRLIEAMSADPFLQQMLEAQGEATICRQILEDTDQNRKGGKAYSSISTGVAVWTTRVRKAASK